MKRVFLSFVMGVAVICAAVAQSNQLQLMLIPSHDNGLYKVGEQVKMKVIATRCGLPLNDVEVSYEVSEDKMDAHIEKVIKLKGCEATINVGSMKKPGFLRVRAKLEHDGKKASTMSTIGFDTDKLTPTVTLPKDFDEFWNGNLERLKKYELRPIMTLVPERCTKTVDVYHVSYRNIGGSRMYGMLTMPKAEGKYPAILRLPGAGIGEKTGDIKHAEQGAIVLELGIHGIPVNMKGTIYDDLSNGVLAGYYVQDVDNRDEFYYKRVYLGCVKGVDFLLSLPQCNGKVGTLGGSQGGALSIVTSRLDERVAATAIYFPAICDLEGYVHGRAGGWPNIFQNEANRTKENLNTIRYYDAANFARGLKAPVFYAFGYNDVSCAPTTTQATYNIITAPKILSIGENTGHWLYTDQVNAMWNWIIEELKK